MQIVLTHYHYNRGDSQKPLNHLFAHKLMTTTNTWRFVTMGFLSFLLGCGKNVPSTSAEITEGEELGWHDLAFTIKDYSRQSDGNQIIDLVGSHGGTQVSLRAALSCEWKERLPDDQVPLTTYRGTVTFYSVGKESDNFVSSLDAIYGTRIGVTKCKKESCFTGISLGGDPRSPEKGEVKIKLFYEQGGQNRYAELFFNVLLDKKTVQLHEKDPEYRACVVRAFAE